MLESIKSSYFTPILFSYLNDSRKLKLIKCNKNLQIKLDISIINYKFLSGRYAIYESNWNRKEYDGNSEQLIYKWGYLNGKRNEKGWIF